MAAGPDDEPFAHRGPPPPEDRLWRHPSELSPARGRAGWGYESGPPRSWQTAPRVVALAGAAAFIGAAVSLGAVLLARGFPSGGGEADVVPTQGFAERFEALPTSTGGPRARGARIAQQTGGSVVGLVVPTETGSRSGAGVVVDRAGRIVTNAHVVAGATELTVELADGVTRQGRVLGSDEATDLAVVQVSDPPDSVLPAPRGTSRRLTDGETVTLVTSTTHTTGVVTQGEVESATTRVSGVGGTILHGVIETDLPVADDESGSALTDGSGLVIGIATAVPSAGGAGYAVPIELVHVVVDSIVNHGEMRHVYLGIEGNDVLAHERTRLGVGQGARINRVWDGSPAALAGLAPDDVVVTLDGHRIRSISALVLALRLHRPGEIVQLDYIRDGKRHSATATLAERPD